ncbi:MAG: metal-dependent hydrolase [Pirellulaceae bacterium]
MSVNLTWLGHATWLLVSGEHQILIDPFLTDNPSAQVSPSEVDADFILITHGHADHTADAAEIAKRCGAKLIANFEIANWFAAQGVADTLGMNLGGTAELACGRVKMTVAHHSSSLPDGSYGGCPAGFVVETGGRRIYFAGDTALFSDMQLIGNMGLDVAVLPIGDLFTMGPADTIAAAQLLKAKLVLPAHYNTWPPIAQDAAQWVADMHAQADCQAKAPAVGETLKI